MPIKGRLSIEAKKMLNQNKSRSTFTLNIDKELKINFDNFCTTNGLSMTVVIVTLIERLLSGEITV